jgi:hypothetical protein
MPRDCARRMMRSTAAMMMSWMARVKGGVRELEDDVVNEGDGGNNAKLRYSGIRSVSLPAASDKKARRLWLW